MPQEKTKTAASGKSLEVVLQDSLRKFEGMQKRRSGSILLRLTGDGGGDFHVHSSGADCRLSREPGVAPPLVEVIGGVEPIRAVLEGRREGLAQFYRGGIRVRGDLHYLSELAHEMGLIREPF